MASTDELENEGSVAVAAPAAAKLPIVPLIIAMFLAVVLGAGAVGGGIFYMIKSGKLGVGGGVAKVEAHEVEVPKTHQLVLEPILVNLADDGGHSYLRVGITMSILDDVPVKGEKKKEEKAPEKGAPKGPTEAETAARDTVLTVLGQQNAETLLETDGKDVLKTKLKAALAAHNPTLKLSELFFTEFLVQR